ncbi:hypothetical protein V491_09367 [Pseudogymnoascus sp. VKM F-3775]|nr:hypothetical protein V491_09367 [Pseudogymnoascus sp. VKM F-3775]
MAPKKKLKAKKISMVMDPQSARLSPCEAPDKIATETDLRKSSYIKAMQSDRITILVGPTEKTFSIPEALLTRYSPPLGRMCQSRFMESQTRVIKLPEVKISTFEEFFIWIHVYEPRVNDESFESTLDLAIFAEIYMIFLLKNQTSDILRAGLRDGRWELKPSDVSTVYENVPSRSVIRQLFSVSLALAVQGGSKSFGNSRGSILIKEHPNVSQWEEVFGKHAEIGWDYFREVQTAQAQSAISGSGPCRFHDHRDIHDASSLSIGTCPYLYLTPWTTSRNETRSHNDFEGLLGEVKLVEVAEPVDEAPVDEEATIDEAF